MRQDSTMGDSDHCEYPRRSAAQSEEVFQLLTPTTA
jgi:hypothetical protein